MLSVIIPAYNEENRLPATLKEIGSYLDQGKTDYEIIVVDDGSKDKTALKVKEIKNNNGRVQLLQNEKNRGKGFSVRKGILAAQGEYILFCDADGSTPISELDKLLTKLEA